MVQGRQTTNTFRNREVTRVSLLFEQSTDKWVYLFDNKDTQGKGISASPSLKTPTLQQTTPWPCLFVQSAFGHFQKAAYTPHLSKFSLRNMLKMPLWLVKLL
jgi:hypothetical protein